MTGQMCADGCGEPAKTRGYSHRCYRRWYSQSFPEGGPRPPMSDEERGRRSALARAPEPDPYDVQWLAGAPERRVRRVRAQAADLVRCVVADDAEGIRILLQERVTDWEALTVVLAECADPVRTAIVCGPTLAVVAAPALGEGERPASRREAASVDQRAAEGDADAAA